MFHYPILIIITLSLSALTTPKPPRLPITHWYCDRTRSIYRCTLCLDHYPELSLDEGGCPNDRLYQTKDLCETSNFCNNLPTTTQAAPTPSPWKTHHNHWYCDRTNWIYRCALCPDSYQEVPSDNGGCQNEVLYHTKGLCEADTLCKRLSTTASQAIAKTKEEKIHWYCNSKTYGDGCSSCRGDYGELPFQKGGCPRGTLYANQKSCDDDTLCKKLQITTNEPQQTGIQWYCSSEASGDAHCKSCIANQGQLPEDEGGCPDDSLYPNGSHCGVLKWCSAGSPTCSSGCRSQCRSKTKNNFYSSFKLEDCFKCSGLECCDGRKVYEKYRDCIDKGLL